MYEVSLSAFYWIEKELEIDAEHIGDSLFWLLKFSDGVCIEWDEESGEPTRRSTDLDEIYDVYLLPKMGE
jgi:hypothetical protein